MALRTPEIILDYFNRDLILICFDSFVFYHFHGHFRYFFLLSAFQNA